MDHEQGGLGIPRSVELVLKYYQVSPTHKRLMKASMVFRDYNDTPSGDYGYTFTFTMETMPYMDLLNNFGFDLDLYLIFDSLFIGLSLVMLVPAPLVAAPLLRVLTSL